uniref:Mannosyltransferase n=1 Tax=Pseudo-nitzschia australis TaxID=44445 RepID=A0A7S4AXL5_9STRA|mmetsp:Transcript_6987/g.14875  ORF Transcript_6987/g.14875 Transcript_6987/m.14875 type:complete len:583 (-) Transcript_6987:109-1857(-)
MTRTRIGFWVSAAFLFATSLFDLLLCPQSKVEESFQLQATHDLYYHGVAPALQAGYPSLWNHVEETVNVDYSGTPTHLPYDHLQYPGVVPRTFTGPAILSFLCRILLLPCSLLNIDADPDLVQFLARLCLLSLNFLGWLRFALAVDKVPPTSTPWRIGNPIMTTGSWLLVITACQFHIPFYSSRMLPNTFALAIVLQSYSYWVERKIQTAATLIVFGTAVFRCDLLLLLGTLGLSWLFRRELSIYSALKVGILTGIISLILTIPLDSLLWRRPLWPEGEVFYFNTILGKSKEWGLSPWHWYFTSALPKGMLLTLLLVPLSILPIAENLVTYERRWRQSPNNTNDRSRMIYRLDSQWLRFILPIFGFIVIYSLLGHKEMRFIFPAFPILNLGAAAGMSKLTYFAFPPRLESKEKHYFVSWIARFGFGCGLISIVLTLAGSLIFVATSKANYSGGDALRALSSHVQNVVVSSDGTVPPLHVHIDVAAAMSGVSLFGQRAAQTKTPNIEWNFSKDGYEDANSMTGQSSNGYEQFTHLLSEDPEIVSSSIFTVVHTQQGRPRFSFRDRKIVTEDTIFVFEKNRWRN